MKAFRASSLLALGLLTAGSAFAATGTGTARAQIVQAISISNPIPLQFGSVVPSGTSGTVTMGLNGVRTTTGGATLASSAGFNTALFTVNGAPTFNYAVTLPGSATLDDGTGHTMTVDSFASFAGLGYTLSSLGFSTFIVGATLHVGANQAVGDYVGNFVISIDYN